VHRLRASRLPVVLLTAPAGYGKTTLLRQWAAEDPRPFIRLRARDVLRDPAALASALDPAESRVVVIDDAHLLPARRTVALLEDACAGLGDSSRIVLAGRRSSPTAQRCARKGLGALELGPVDLRLSHEEAERVLAAHGFEPGTQRTDELVRIVEGWPAALRLASHAAWTQRGGTILDGAGRIVNEYVDEEVLQPLTAREQALLRRTSIVAHLSGPLCDAILDATGSARALSSIASSTRLLEVEPGSRAGLTRYRLHPLVRAGLRAQLERYEPERVAGLQREASRWCAGNGLPDVAAELALASGDHDRAVSLLEAAAPPTPAGDRLDGLARCIDELEARRLLDGHPTVAMLGARVHALSGRADEAERLAALAERGFREAPPEAAAPAASVEAIRALLCRDGLATMRADATIAVRSSSADSPWHAIALALLGVAELLGGDASTAERLFEEASTASAISGSADVGAAALAERSLIAAVRGDHATSRGLARAARELVVDARLAGFPTAALVWAAGARAAADDGDWDGADRDLAEAEAILPQLTWALPWLAVQVRLELVGVLLRRHDSEQVRAHLGEVDAVLERRGGLGIATSLAARYREQLESLDVPAGGWPATLTSAERKLLPFLMTHLTLAEVAAELGISRNTVKTQAVSVYRKLRVSSRSEAIAAAADLGLLPGSGAAR
jgi:LuxR family maltose regulon positive regulatory protein